MTKSLALLALGALLLTPAVDAQVLPAHDLDVAISGLPTNATVNETLFVQDFTVTATVSGGSACLAQQGTSYDFTVTAVLVNASSNKTTVQVSPAAFSVSGPNLQPGSVTRTQTVTLVVNPGTFVDAANATIQVTVASDGGNPGCSGGGSTAPTQAMADLKVAFATPEGFAAPEPAGQEMPGVPAVFLMVALAALVAIVRKS